MAKSVEKLAEHLGRDTNELSPHGLAGRHHVALVLAALIEFAIMPVASRGEDFHGYPCTDDCSGHEAGYDWAEDNGIHDDSDCSGNSQSFIEGCQAYTEENPNEDSDDQGDDRDERSDVEQSGE